MKIGVIKIYPVRVPFRLHPPSWKQVQTNVTNIVIEINDAKSRVRGFGEGCLPPHKQIFMEDWIKAAASFLSVDTFPWNLNSIYEIQAYIGSLPTLSSLNPVVCAIETALLDLLGRRQGKPLSAYFPSRHAAGFIRYAASIPACFSKKQAAQMSRAARHIGITTLRLGIGSNPMQTLKRLEAVTTVFGNRCSLGLNPGLTWDLDSYRAHIPLLERFPIHAVEDPMPIQADGLAELAGRFKSMGIKLIAGQTAATVDSAAVVVSAGLHDAASIQLSRSGGFQRSLALIDYLRRNGVDFQIGCHPAETAILSSAGHVLNLLCCDAVDRETTGAQFVDGTDRSAAAFQINHGGKALPSQGTGLGATVNHAAIAPLRQNRFNGKQVALTIKPVG